MTILLSDYILGLVMIFQLSYALSPSVMDCYTAKILIDCTGSHLIKKVVNINQCHWLCFQRFSASGLKYVNSSQRCTCIPNDSPLDLNFDPGIRSCLVSENLSHGGASIALSEQGMETSLYYPQFALGIKPSDIMFWPYLTARRKAMNRAPCASSSNRLPCWQHLLFSLFLFAVWQGSLSHETQT